MNNEMKAGIYAQLLNEHRRLSNQISSIKGESIELSPKQKQEIDRLQNEQVRLMQDINKLFG